MLLWYGSMRRKCLLQSIHLAPCQQRLSHRLPYQRRKDLICETHMPALKRAYIRRRRGLQQSIKIGQSQQVNNKSNHEWNVVESSQQMPGAAPAE